MRRWLKPLRRFHPYCTLFEALDVERSWVVSTVSCGQGFSHPLKHIIVLGAIEADWRDLVNAASRPGFQLALDLTEKTKEIWTDEEVLEVLKSSLTLTEAAAKLRCDVTTMSVRAQQVGFEAKRKPKKVTAAVRTQVLDLVRHGQKSSQIAESLNLSVTTVNRIRRGANLS